MNQVSRLNNGPPPGGSRPVANPSSETPDAASPFGVIHSRQIRSAIASHNVYKALYAESHAAKVWRVAQVYLTRENGVHEYPEHVPASSRRYETKPAQFWTCAFLPSCLYALLERRTKFPKSLPIPNAARGGFNQQLLDLCREWSGPLHQNALRQDTHDLGFMMQPLRMDWELTSNKKSLGSVVTAAYNLSSRFSDRTGVIRCWNAVESRTYHITDLEDNYLVIIDSMANLDLLFYVGNLNGDQSLIDRATSHAQVLIKTLIRTDFSTFHVANLNPLTGEVKQHFTHQGYSDNSCWSRGQAWAILGFTQTYKWTTDPTFLVVAMSLANFFVQRLSRATHDYGFVPPWDFDAPTEPDADVLRDTSAGMIAANGLLLLHQVLQGQSPFLDAVRRIVEHTLAYSLSRESASFQVDANGQCSVGDIHHAILMHSTANNNENAMVRYGDHGLIYADYYFLELGNILLRMGLA